MKKFFYLMIVAAFLVAGTIAFAADKPAASTPMTGKTVNCCVKGQCKQAASPADCTKAGGKVVKDCKACK